MAASPLNLLRTLERRRLLGPFSLFRQRSDIQYDPIRKHTSSANHVRTGMDLLAKKYHSNSYRCKRGVFIGDTAHSTDMHRRRRTWQRTRLFSTSTAHIQQQRQRFWYGDSDIIIIVIARAVSRPDGRFRSPKERFESLQNADAFLC
jgi:hypothetical protein